MCTGALPWDRPATRGASRQTATEATSRPGSLSVDTRYWPFQFIETGIFVALAAVLIAVSFAVINRRDA